MIGLPPKLRFLFRHQDFGRFQLVKIYLLQQIGSFIFRYPVMFILIK